jgi:hypothetical protein
MLSHRAFASSRATGSPTLGRIAATGCLLLSCAAAGCFPSYAFRGTGSLEKSGQPSAQLASQVAAVNSCHDDNGPYSLLVIGDDCRIEGTGDRVYFQPEPGGLCTLSFPDGRHELRVTDANARYTGPGYYLEVTLGGDETQTGEHVVYRFRGNAMAPSTDPSRCDRAHATITQTKKSAAKPDPQGENISR